MEKSIDDIFEYVEDPKGAKYDELRDKLKEIYNDASAIKRNIGEIALQAKGVRTTLLGYARDGSADDDEVSIAVDVYNNAVDDFNAFCQQAAELYKSIQKMTFRRRAIEEAEE